MIYYEMVILFVYVTASTNIVCSSTTTLNSTKVALWSDTPISADSKLAVDNLVTKLNLRFKISLTVEVVPLNFSIKKVNDILRSLENYHREGWTFVVTALSTKNTWLWSTLLCQRNSIIIDIRNPRTAAEIQKKFFPKNYLSLVPPVSERRRVLQYMLNHMLCRTNITLTCVSSGNAEENLRKQLKIAKNEMIFCIVVECSANPNSLFTIANKLGLLESRYRWFSSHHFELDNLKDLPRNLISIQLSKFGDSRKDAAASVNIHFLSDALTLVAEIKTIYEDNFSKYSSMREFLETRFEGETGLVYFNQDHSYNGSNYDVFQLIRVSNTTGWLRIGVWEKGSFDTRLMAWIMNSVLTIKPPLLRISTKRSKPWVFFTANQDVDPNNSECVVGIKCINYTSYYSETNNSFVEHCCSGMLVELLQDLMKRISFTPRLQFVKDGKFGSLNKTTNQWNGMIGEVLRNEADTALYSLTITERRAKAVEFSYPIISAGSGIIVSIDKRKSYETLNGAVLRPFTTELWCATIGVLAVSVVTLWLAERLNKQHSYRTFLGNRNKLSIHTLIESLSYGWGVFVQKAVQEGGPSTLGGRVIVSTFGFCMIIVLCSYTANLAAIKVVEDEKTEISGIYDDKFLNPTSEFKFTSSKFTATSEFFKLSPDDRLNRIYHVMKDRLVSTRAEALKLLKSGEIQAFFEDTPSLHYMASQQEDCSLKVVGKSFGNSGYGMPFRSNSSWRNPISAAIREMHADATIRKLSERWLEAACVTKESANTARPLGMRGESGILIVLAVFCVGSFFLLALELVFKKTFSNVCFSYERKLSYELKTLETFR